MAPLSRSFCALLLLAPLSSLAQASGPDPGPPTLRAIAVSAAEEPRLDGRLDDAAWANAPKAANFVQRLPNAGEPAGERTEVSVLYGDAALYVGFKCWVRDPATLVARLARRDEFVGSDRVAVAFDSYNDDRTAFYFGVTAAGVEQDLLMYNDNNEDDSWDAIWDGKAARFTDDTGSGYSVEMRIPFSQLRYQTGAGPEVWGIQFQRRVPASGEDVFWAPVLPDVDGFVSRFGQLDGLDVQRAPRQIELLPYAVSQLTRAPGDPDNPFYSENDFRPNVGFDAKVGLSSNLTLTATVNPDFGQVEADPAVVNLSQFETFFEERRPFFVEGVDIFNYGRTRTNNVSYRPTFFYSRRIGRSPTRFVGGETISYVDSPQQTTIATAAKVSGKIGPWSVGLLDAITMEETARYITTTGAEETTPVEPLSNFLVGRVRRDFRQGNTVVGGILTAANRQMGSDGLFDDLTASSAVMGGVDFEHRFAERKWALSGVAAMTSVSGTTGFVERLQRAPQRYYQRPDSDGLGVEADRTTLSGLYSEVSLNRSVENSWDASLTANVATPGLELNDLGFQSRADIATLNYFVGRRMSNPGPFRRASLYNYGGVGTNFDGDLVNHFYGGGAFAEFQNRWTLELNGGFNPTYKNDRLTRGGPLAERPSDGRIEVSVGTDSSKPISAHAYSGYRAEFANDYSGAAYEYDAFGGFSVTFRPSNALSISIEPSYSRQRDNDQFVTSRADEMATSTFGRRYVFANIDQTSFDVGVRTNWTFTPDLSLQLYAQPFVTSGQFTGFKEFTTPGSFDFATYGEAQGTITPVTDGEGMVVAYDVNPGDGGDPFRLNNNDFNFRSLRGNAVLRWEYRPGSALFLVWQQLRTESAPYDGFGIAEELGEVFRAPVENVFLIKASYWFGL